MDETHNLALLPEQIAEAWPRFDTRRARDSKRSVKKWSF